MTKCTGNKLSGGQCNRNASQEVDFVGNIKLYMMKNN